MEEQKGNLQYLYEQVERQPVFFTFPSMKY